MSRGKAITTAIASHFIKEQKPRAPSTSWWATPAHTRAEFVEAAKARDAEMGWSAGSRGRELQTCYDVAGSRGRELQTCYDDWRMTR